MKAMVMNGAAECSSSCSNKSLKVTLLL